MTPVEKCSGTSSSSGDTTDSATAHILGLSSRRRKYTSPAATTLNHHRGGSQYEAAPNASTPARLPAMLTRYALTGFGIAPNRRPNTCPKPIIVAVISTKKPPATSSIGTTNLATS